MVVAPSLRRLRPLLLATLFLVGCEDNNPVEDMSATGGVIPCNSTKDCPADRPMCTPDSHVCAGCTDSFQTCGAGLTCDTKTNSCVPADPQAPCHKNADCPRPGFDSTKAISCDVDAGICYECTSNMDCVAPDTCHLDIHACVTPDAGT